MIYADCKIKTYLLTIMHPSTRDFYVCARLTGQYRKFDLLTLRNVIPEDEVQQATCYILGLCTQIHNAIAM